MMEKMAAGVRSWVLRLIADETLFLLCAFLFAGVINSSVFTWYRQAIDLLYSYMVIPWGLALCVLHLQRADGRMLLRTDNVLLTLMFAWVTVPFFLRFGLTFNNVTNWYGHAVVFFAVYAATREADDLEKKLDVLCALFAALSFVWGGMLLLCALTGVQYGLGTGGELFGVVGGMLQSGMHYNHTGMVSVCMMMMCVTGACRRKSLPGRLAHAVPAAMMALVIVLTQSRTARYSMLIAWAAGVYGALAAMLPARRKAVRHAAALAAALAVLVAGYLSASALTDAALRHYSGEPVLTAQAAAEEEAPAAGEPALQARAAVDATFSDRTALWKNLFAYWRSNPKYLLMGNGVGRTGSLIVEGTIHQEAGGVAVHNTYLQLLADFGLVGAALTLAFFITLLRPALRLFFAPRGEGFAGGRALLMMVLAILATGMMESQPLGVMSPMNMMLYYAFAVISAQGRA